MIVASPLPAVAFTSVGVPGAYTGSGFGPGPGQGAAEGRSGQNAAGTISTDPGSTAATSNRTTGACTPLDESHAAAARRMGLNEVPLMCAREIPVPGAMPGVIRVMLHTYVPAGRKVRHIYLGETRNLRADLDAAQ